MLHEQKCRIKKNCRDDQEFKIKQIMKLMDRKSRKFRGRNLFLRERNVILLKLLYFKKNQK